MSEKNTIRTCAVIVGLSGIAAARHWPEYAALIEILLYSMIILGVLLSSFWSDRRRSGFWTGMSIVFLLHGVVLFFIHSYFPFRTILTVVPILLVEGIVVIIIMVKVLGDDQPVEIEGGHTEVRHRHPK
jgi:phosphatidylglycerophosphate synthase